MPYLVKLLIGVLSWSKIGKKGYTRTLYIKQYYSITNATKLS